MMRPHTLFVILLAGIVAAFGSGVGCATLTGVEDKQDLEYDVAQVDSLDVPTRISPSDTLTIRMTGTVGPNGCYSFNRFSVERAPGRLSVTPVVTRATADDVACTMAIVPLDETYTAAPPFEDGELTVVVPQPDRPDVTKTLEVK